MNEMLHVNSCFAVVEVNITCFFNRSTCLLTCMKRCNLVKLYNKFNAHERVCIECCRSTGINLFGNVCNLGFATPL